MPKAATATRRQGRSGTSRWVDLCLSLRSSIRRRLEAEEAEQDNPEDESNPVEQADNPDNPVEAAAQEAIQTKLDEQPSPVVEPKAALRRRRRRRV